jgi:CBS domain-containing protein
MQGIGGMIRKHVVGVAKTASVATALTLMRNANVSIIPVLDDGRLVGVVTRQLALDNSNANLSVRQIMRGPEMCVDEKASVDQVADKMIKEGVGRLPVVNNKHEMLFVGVITSTEIVRQMKK